MQLMVNTRAMQCYSPHVMHAGSLPSNWGGAAAFPSLTGLSLFDMPLTGTLPASWADNGSFPALNTLALGTARSDMSCLSGTLPGAWGSTLAFQKLQRLSIDGCLTGMLQQH